MLIIPAIDLKQGRCVRLTQGEAGRETVYDTDPAAVARKFQEEGAQKLHLVDLDGAFQGRTANLEVIRRVREVFHHPIELGGGIRTLEDISGMLALGINHVIVGTMAVRQPAVLEQALAAHGGEKIYLGIDAKQGKVAVSGWVEETQQDAVEFALGWKAKGIQRVIFTDIARDGMMNGPNLQAIEAFARATGLAVTASGGVSNPQDLLALAGLKSAGVDSAIVGKAIYEGKVNLREALAC
ncbi:MAG: 1-(5-phosphoribosyl)-5-[(5-phosphoribosylamino)methylideneamino]imidazole-4-carboxamide isomerase [Deltaproteobacteria bacterium]|nr:1-(5-phosphoribosyl)-5-[(5-phosphoribosylamino)methylideneamino]imidazole-4-carboxamide isomerase [Deltaproteobacteria bacterium]